jgi:hypothetical protein
MLAIKVGVREFREQFACYLESDTPVAVKPADQVELRAAADRLAAALADEDEEEVVAEFKKLRRRKVPCR